MTIPQVHAPYSKFLVTCHDDAAWAEMETKEQGQLLRQLMLDGETSDADLVKRCTATSAARMALTSTSSHRQQVSPDERQRRLCVC
jgi:hypothetical protein